MKHLLDWATATPERRICLALLGLMIMVYIPLAGNYGMWDPWETHYGEVARQMLERNDFISLWWPGSPQDRMEFWSKPILTFWLMALSMKLGGIEWANARASEIADSWRVEWASRLPFVALGILGVWATWEIVRRLAGRRAGAFAAVILATSSQWAIISRQAMTDMAFVTPMTIALCFAGLGLLLPSEEAEGELPRKSAKLGPLRLSWPHATPFYVFLTTFVLCAIPQLVMTSIQLHVIFRVSNLTIRMIGLVPMLPYIALTAIVLWWCFRTPVPVEKQQRKGRGWNVWGYIVDYLKYKRVSNRRELFMLTAWVMCALATLAKGPAGVALPAIVLIVYLVLSGRWKDIFDKLELPLGIAIFVAVGFPWYHAMLIRHGMGFWNEFIGDNYVHRAGGRHGDRGTFEYYIQYVFYGMFPWSGIVTLGGLFSFRWLRTDDKRRALAGYALIWFISEFTVMSLVNTKFHHYILPALPALAILGGLFLDEVLSAPERLHGIALLLVALPITFLSGRDLSAFPARLLWLFNYDYVNMPGTGRPWPVVSLYGDRYEYQSQIMVFAVVATLAVLALGWTALSRARAVSAEDTASQPTTSTLLGLLVVFAGALVVAIGAGPSSPNGAAPTLARTAWMLPVALMLPFVALAAIAVGGAGFVKRARSVTVWTLALVGVVWTGFLLDKILIELSPHWSQKHVIASYYAKRSGPEEPLIAWQLYWRGENFYTRNEIYRSQNPAERSVFLGDHNAEKMQEFFKAKAGRRVFFVVERTRYEALRQLLPAAAKPNLSIVDETNNKIYLAVVQL
jgi:4-amino-4-deoxy-L-arabinose transferase-like glycosyltransferase